MVIECATADDFRAWLAASPPRRPRPSAQPVRLSRDGDRLDVVLDRPWARNAFDAAEQVAELEAPEQLLQL